MTDEDDDLDWDEWMQMTDAQHEAILEAEMRQYIERWNSLTPLQQYRRSRSSALHGCLVWRKTIRQFRAEPGDFFWQQLRQRQLRLVKLRIQLSTGVYPGSA